jgi:hypothetical protein
MMTGKDIPEEAEMTKPEKGKIIRDYHNSPMAGHPRVKRTLDLLKRRGYKWKGIRKDVKDYIGGCLTCQKVKPKTGPGADPLQPMPIAEGPWEIISWDLVGPLPESRTYDAIVTMVDTKMKAIKLEVANVTITAMGTTVIMRDRIYQEEGLPCKVISDRGPQFVSGFMWELYKLLQVEGNPSTTYHPQMDGQTERVNRGVEKYLRTFVNH